MQYYTAELWWKINDEDENTRKQAEEEWDRNRLLYQRQFEEAKKRLPRKFIKDFLAREELHDYVILGQKRQKLFLPPAIDEPRRNCNSWDWQIESIANRYGDIQILYDGYDLLGIHWIWDYLRKCDADGSPLRYAERNEISISLHKAYQAMKHFIFQNWNFSLLEEDYIYGVDSEYEGRFFRYK